MKRRIMFVIALTLAFLTMYAWPVTIGERLSLMAKPIKVDSELKPLPKSPVQVPEVYLDGDTLYFDASIEGCTVQLVDASEDVVFSDPIEENQTSLTLPDALTGTFELQIIRGSYIFYCEIEL